ncbi:DUF3892 domain-containing protein [Bradyrhizobium diazoefficiens]|uniref:DUF3892 domain-containing protein n=1 Tax=Bradyrhizobium diazoefficiens TaxID=1355477 RepID=UPI00384D947D
MNAGECVRRLFFVIFAPDSQQESSPLSGRKSTQATVRICGASSVVQTIRDIESGAWEFYVQEDGLTAGLIVAKHEGHKYIKTTADGIQPDSLLSLAECPPVFSL